MPREIRRQQWSFLNTRSSSCAVCCSGCRSGTECVHFGWRTACQAVVGSMRCIAAMRAFDPEKGCPNGSTHKVSRGAHFSVRAQERLPNAAADHAKVSAFETALTRTPLQRPTTDAPALPAQSRPCVAVLPIPVPGTLQARSPDSTSRASRCSHGWGERVHSVALHVVAPSSRAVTRERGRVARQI